MFKAVATLTTMIALSAALVPNAGAAPPASTPHPGVGGSGAAACIVSYPSPADAGGRPFGVTAGPGGTWYSDGNTLNRIHDGSTTTYTVAGVDASDTVGLGWLTWDGKDTIWFAAGADGRIGTITGDGTITTIQVPEGTDGPAVVQGFVLHPGRDLWFSDQLNNRIGDYSLTTDQFTFYQVPSEGPQSLAESRDGDLYFVERPVDKVGRLDPRTGLFTEWSLPAGSFPNRIITTPDGAEWFTALLGNYVGPDQGRTPDHLSRRRRTGGHHLLRGASLDRPVQRRRHGRALASRHGHPHLEHPGRQPATAGRQRRQALDDRQCRRVERGPELSIRVPRHSLNPLPPDRKRRHVHDRGRAGRQARRRADRAWADGDR